MLSKEWLQAFVPIGIPAGSNRWRAIGAGVLFLDSGILWLVTANHVLRNAQAERITPLLRKTDGGVALVKLGDVQKSSKTSWIQDEKLDLAAAPLPVFEQVALKAVSEHECLRIADV